MTKPKTYVPEARTPPDLLAEVADLIERLEVMDARLAAQGFRLGSLEDERPPSVEPGEDVLGD